DGSMTSVAGTAGKGFSGDGGPASAAQLSQPEDIIFDAIGNAYIADVTNDRIRQITPDGIIHTFAGTGVRGHSGDGGPASVAMLNTPRSLAIDSQGNLYFGEHNANRLRRIAPDGIITTVAGDGRLASTGDGGPAISASTQTPSGVTADA